MKTQIMIIKHNFDEFFATKQVLEALLRVPVQVVGLEGREKALECLQGIKVDKVLFRTGSGGIKELIANLRKKRFNRLNSELTILLAEGMEHRTVLRIANDSIVKRRSQRMNSPSGLAS